MLPGTFPWRRQRSWSVPLSSADDGLPCTLQFRDIHCCLSDAAPLARMIRPIGMPRQITV
jgi:hypothetical protein